MSKMLIIFIACLAFNVVFTNGDCKFDKGLVTTFDSKQLEGVWLNWLINDKETADTYACCKDHYNATTNTLSSVIYVKRSRTHASDVAKLQDFKSGLFSVQFGGPLSDWNGKYKVIAQTDVYSIIQGCFPEGDTRVPTPDDLNACKQGVEDLGYEWKDFYSFCEPAEI